MARTWRTVRVFISSTFRDMHAERDQLVKVVFPELRQRLEAHRVHLVDIDLRWGITRQQAENNRAVALCLEQIDSCRPFFVGLLGERYGWVPDRLQGETASRLASLGQSEPRSVTELEILYGVLCADSAQRGLFFFRDPAATDEIPEPLKSEIYVDRHPAAREKLRQLKARIRASGSPLVDGYPARWDHHAFDPVRGEAGRLAGLETFAGLVTEQLWQSLRDQLELAEVARPADRQEEEEDHHRGFVETRLRAYVPRAACEQQLRDYLDGDDCRPCLLTGCSGAGKSAVLAQWSEHVRRNTSDCLVLAHFAGASPRSTSLAAMLERFCQRLIAHFDLESDLPASVRQLPYYFQRLVSERLPPGARLFVVVDALDQFDMAERPETLEWLPATLPPSVKWVHSCLVSEPPPPMLAALLARPHCRVELGPLTEDERLEIVRRVPSLSAKTLEEEQVRLLLANRATANPLYLLVALEELRGFGSFEQLDDKIRSFPREPRWRAVRWLLACLRLTGRPPADALTAIFDQVLERLEAEFDAPLVRHLLVSLVTARRGLSERELQQLSSDLPTAGLLYPILRPLRPYLQTRGNLLDFYHRHLSVAVRRRYLQRPADESAAHRRLADLFAWQPEHTGDAPETVSAHASWQPVPQRPLDELPWQLCRAAEWDRLAETITCLTFLEAKVAAGMVYDLLRDYREAVTALPAEHPRRPLLALLREAVQRQAGFLFRRPDTLFQTLWNAGWWHDRPGADPHDQLRDRELELDNSGAGLSALLERWLAEKKLREPGFPWLKSLATPAVPLGGARLADIPVTAKRPALSSDGQRVLADGEIWDAETGEKLTTRRRQRDRSTVGFSSDGRWMIEVEAPPEEPQGAEFRSADAADSRSVPDDSGQDEAEEVCARPSIVQVTDVETGQVVATFSATLPGFNTLAVSPDGRRFVCDRMDGTGTLQIWDVPSGQLQGELVGHRDSVRCAAFSPDGRFVATGGYGSYLGEDRQQRVPDNSLRVWEVATGQQQGAVQLPDWPDEISFLRHVFVVSKQVLWGCDRRVRRAGCTLNPEEGLICHAFDVGLNVAYATPTRIYIRDLVRKREVALPEPAVTHLSFSGDFRRLLSRSPSRTTVWDLSRVNDPQPPNRIFIHDFVWAAAGDRLLLATSTGSVYELDMTTGGELERLAPSEPGEVESLLVSPGGHQVLVRYCREELVVWNTQRGAERLRETIAQLSRAAWLDEERLVIATRDGQLRVITLPSECSPAVTAAPREFRCPGFEEHSDSVGTIQADVVAAVSPASGWVAVARYELNWDRLGCHDENLHEVAAQPPARVYLWHPDTGDRRHLEVPRGDLEQLVFTNDGRRLLVELHRDHHQGGVEARRVQLWNVDTCRLESEHDLWANMELTLGACCFSPDDRLLYSRGSDGLTQVRHVPSWTCLQLIPGNCDLSTAAAGWEQFPWRAAVEEPGEIVIRSAVTEQLVGCLPLDAIGPPVPHPRGRAWAVKTKQGVELFILQQGERAATAADLEPQLDVHRQREALSRRVGQPRGEAIAIGCQAVSHYQRKEYEQAETLRKRLEQITQGQGRPNGLAWHSDASLAWLLYAQQTPDVDAFLAAAEERANELEDQQSLPGQGHFATELVEQLLEQSAAAAAAGRWAAARVAARRAESLCRTSDDYFVAKKLCECLFQHARACLGEQDLAVALGLFEQAIALSRAQDGRFVPAALYNQGLALERLGRTDEALARYRESADDAHTRQNGAIESLSQRQLALTRERLGHPLAEVQVLLGSSRQAAEQAGLPGELQQTLAEIARVSVRQGLLDEAHSAASARASLCRQLDDREPLAVALCQTAEILARCGEPEQALTELTEAAEIARLLQLPAAERRALVGQAMLAVDLDRADLAERASARHRDLCESNAPSVELARGLDDWSSIYYFRGDHDRALQLCLQNEGIYRQQHDQSALLAVLDRILGLQYALGLLNTPEACTAALARLDERDQLCQQRGESEFAPLLLTVRATALETVGEFQAALAARQQQASLCTQLNDLVGRAAALEEQARLHELLGEPDLARACRAAATR